jgi:hypothetical protein
VIWPAPDANGDADVLYEERTDGQGRSLGRQLVKDQWGKEVRNYFPPKGFANVPNMDRRDCYVMVDERQQVVRQPNGEAINLAPGQALVMNADGSVEYLDDDYAQHLFKEAHDLVESEE